MFTSWVRRKSLKKNNKSRFLSSSTGLSPVMLMSMMGLLLALGVFVVQHTLAAQRSELKPTPTPIAAP